MKPPTSWLENIFENIEQEHGSSRDNTPLASMLNYRPGIRQRKGFRLNSRLGTSQANTEECGASRQAASRRSFVAQAAGLAAVGATALTGLALPRLAHGEETGAPDVGDTGQNPQPATSPSEATEAAPAPQAPASLPGWVDEQVAQTLLSQADDPQVASILADAQALGEMDEHLASKLLKLAANDPAARAFVAGFRTSYPGTRAGSLTEDDLAGAGEIPLFMQWDTRWGYMEYIGGPMGTKGCCPTCLSMLYAGFSGRCDMSPYIVSRLATESGLCDSEGGTYGEFVGHFAQLVGLDYAEVLDFDTACAYLNDGWALVCNLGEGEFTDVGHYVLVTGWVDDEGSVRVNDPYNSTVDAQVWPLATIYFECNSAYAVRAGNVVPIRAA